MQPLGAEALGERVVERAQIGRELVLQVARQEAQALAGFDRRARQHDAADLAGFQRLDRLGDGEIGLAGAGGPERQGQDWLSIASMSTRWLSLCGRTLRR